MMHTILGANGIIGEELARELYLNYSQDIRLVGRNPTKVNSTDMLCKADLLNPQSVVNALEDTSIAYLTVGLPYRSDIWIRDWVKIMENVIQACKKQQCKLVYFDNTYAYPQGSTKQNEQTTLTSSGQKGKAKKMAVELLLTAISDNDVEAVICRAPEFYGPGKTKGITNSLVFENIQKGKPANVFLRDDVVRTLIYTPDASKAMALIANTPDTYQQTWHLPCDDNRLTYRQFIDEISKQMNKEVKYKILKSFVLKLAALFNTDVKETQELLPRYAIDNIFESNQFKNRFSDFQVTTYQEGIRQVLLDYKLIK